MKGRKSKKSKHTSKKLAGKKVTITYFDDKGKQTEVVELEHDTNIGNKGQLEITNKAYYKMMLYTQLVSTEIGGILLGQTKKNKTTIDDVVLIEQDVSGGSVNFDQDQMAKFMEDNPDYVPMIAGWWHSHGSMGTFFSPTDDTTTREMANIAGRCIAIVSVMGREGFKFLAASSDGKKIENISNVICKPEHLDLVKECNKEIAKKVKQKVYTYTPSQYGNGGYGHGYGYDGYGGGIYNYDEYGEGFTPVKVKPLTDFIPDDKTHGRFKDRGTFTGDGYCLFCGVWIGARTKVCEDCGCYQEVEQRNRELAYEDDMKDEPAAKIKYKQLTIEEEKQEIDLIIARAILARKKEERERNVKQSKLQPSTRDFQPYDF
jgi:proteasome lid subunit RPN8/RPN11